MVAPIAFPNEQTRPNHSRRCIEKMSRSAHNTVLDKSISPSLCWQGAKFNRPYMLHAFALERILVGKKTPCLCPQ